MQNIMKKQKVILYTWFWLFFVCIPIFLQQETAGVFNRLATVSMDQI